MTKPFHCHFQMNDIQSNDAGNRSRKLNDPSIPKSLETPDPPSKLTFISAEKPA